MAGGKSKKRRPLVEAPHRPMRSMRRAREVTSKFHEHTHAIAAAQARGDRAAAQEAQEALDALGGRDAYQQASILTTERSKHTSKWLFSILTKNGMRPGKGQPPLKVLEVGAVNTQILSVPWLDVRAIDINSQHPKIEQKDFFELKPGGEYEVIMCSMVINCVPTPKLRGRMLRGLLGHLRPGGWLFLTLPLRCLTHSPTTTWGQFVVTLKKVGFIPVEWKASPKVAFFCLRRQKDAAGGGGGGDVEEVRLEVPEDVAALAKKTAKTRTNAFQVTL